MQQQPPNNIPDPNMKTLLLWTSWFGTDWYIGQGGYSWDGQKHTDLRDFGCDEESYKCTITTNRSYLSDLSLYDGILFHQVDINTRDIPNQDNRGENQLYIFHTAESPLHSLSINPGSISQDSPLNNKFFNATMTYSTQADIHMPYGRIVQTAALPPDLDQFIRDYGQQNYRRIPSKNFSAVVVVSNCASRSQREEVLSELGRIVPVHVFGKCGQPLPDLGPTNRTTDLHKLLGQTFQFHLSFENSLCEDYVTEKFFNAMGSGMIPVVLNGANMSRIAPTHSYIDVKDFTTIRELGSYLEEVSSDPSLYASYFWWTNFYQVRAKGKEGSMALFCFACRYLHAGGEARVVEDLHKEWVEGRCRQPPIIT